jgi:hypothetical protein
MSKLKDPDAEVIASRHLLVPYHELPFCVWHFPLDWCLQLEIIQILIKECNKIEGHVQQVSYLAFDVCKLFTPELTIWQIYFPVSYKKSEWFAETLILKKKKNRYGHAQLILGIVFLLSWFAMTWYAMAWTNLVFVLAVQEAGPAIHPARPGERWEVPREEWCLRALTGVSSQPEEDFQLSRCTYNCHI